MDFVVSFDPIGPSSGLMLSILVLSGCLLAGLGLSFWSWIPTDRYLSDRQNNVLAVSCLSIGIAFAVGVTTLYAIDVLKFGGLIEDALQTKIDKTTVGLPVNGVETKTVLTTDRGFADCTMNRIDQPDDALVRVQFRCQYRT